MACKSLSLNEIFLTALSSILLVALMTISWVALAHAEEPVPPTQTAPNFFHWRDEKGNFHYVDDLKKVPESLRSQVEARTWAEQAAKIEKKITVSESLRPVVLHPVETEDLAVDSACTGYYTVTSNWGTVDGITRMYYTLRDKCGQIVSVTPFGAPSIYAEP